MGLVSGGSIHQARHQQKRGITKDGEETLQMKVNKFPDEVEKKKSKLVMVVSSHLEIDKNSGIINKNSHNKNDEAKA